MILYSAGRPRTNRGLNWAAFVAVLPCVVWAVRAQATSALNAVEVEPQGQLRRFWSVERAEVQERFSETLGVLEIRNISEDAVRDATFYAEYLDGLDRVCFTLLFTQGEHLERPTGIFRPNEVRRLYADAFYLGAASQPKRMKLYLLSQTDLGATGATISGGAVVRSPVMLESTSLPERLWIDPEARTGRGPLLDLALGRVTVDGQGHLENAELIGAVNDSVRSWFSDLMRNEQFHPAATGGISQQGDALVFARAALFTCLSEAPSLPRDSPLVREYVKGLTGTEAPVIITVLLQPSSPDFWEHPSPAYFELNGAGSGWNLGNTRDGTTPLLPLGPKLRKVMAPTGPCP